MKNQPSSGVETLRERKRRIDSGKTLHQGTLSDLEPEAEEYALALIKDSNPLRFLASLIHSWTCDIYSLISGRNISKSPSLDSSSDATSRSLRLSWAAVCSILFIKTLLLFAKHFEKLGDSVEYYLNLIFANGGIRKTLQKRLFTPGSVIRPCPEDDRYYSFCGLLDTRQDLRLEPSSLSPDSDGHMTSVADLCIMASKLSYENAKVIQRVVSQQWKMNFVQFFDCWNEYLDSKATQAFIFTDRARDANIVVVAFRGTQPFNMVDWSTDFDFSYYALPQMGRVHVGFLEALGLGSRLKRETLKQVKINSGMKADGQTPAATPTSGLSQQILDDDDKVLAYDAICAKVRNLLRANLGAKLYITGHSLGGALAALFTGLLHFERDLMLESLGGVFTFGQPRVGDSKFASYMQQHLCKPEGKKYFRVVFRNDIVPRVPFDDPLFQFKHIGPCHYYSSVSEAKVVQEQPHKNIYTVILLPTPHWSAFKELIISLDRRFLRDRSSSDEFVETGLCLLMRFCALLTPGICAHSPSNYVDAIRSGSSNLFIQQAEVSLEQGSWAARVMSSITWLCPSSLRSSLSFPAGAPTINSKPVIDQQQS